MEDAKQCPFCNEWRLKDNACNYVQCSNNHSDILNNCTLPWCFLCGKPKYTECNDKTHNSH